MPDKKDPTAPPEIVICQAPQGNMSKSASVTQKELESYYNESVNKMQSRHYANAIQNANTAFENMLAGGYATGASTAINANNPWTKALINMSGILNDAYPEKSEYEPSIHPHTYKTVIKLPVYQIKPDGYQTSNTMPKTFEIDLGSPELSAFSIAQIFINYAAEHLTKEQNKFVTDYFLSHQL